MDRVTAMGEAVRFRDLTIGYDRHPAVHHLSGAVVEGSLTAVVGPNGAGKTTLLKSLVGLLRPLGGRIEWGSLAPADIAYLPQQAEIDRAFPITVIDIVMLGHWRRVGAFRPISRDQRREAERALAAVGLDGFGRRSIGSLSAGQFQRVLFARMLLQDARLILLDEPFTAIDARTTLDLIEVIRRWQAERRTIIAVLHDFEQVRAHFPETMLLAREAIGWGPTPQVLTPANLARARAMAEAWDENAAVCRRGVA
jgi:zinc/manganese transport system ATP-binding protein